MLEAGVEESSTLEFKTEESSTLEFKTEESSTLEFSLTLEFSFTLESSLTLLVWTLELSATIEEVVELLAVLEVGTVLEVLLPQEINPNADKARILKSLIDFLFIFYNLSLNNARHISQSLCAIAFLLNNHVYQSK